VITSAGALPAHYVIHAVGPVYHDGKHGEAALLASCYKKCLELADQRQISTVSFPAISTGAYGYPAEEAATIALDTVAEYLQKPGTGVREVLFVLFDRGFYDLHARAAARRFHSKSAHGHS
jgi:O-acetyl-ADP-ribose deacetylase (regulator of RNase III)